jgi:hypothetical protein
VPTHHTSSGALVAAEARVSIGSESQQFIQRARHLHAGLRALASLGEQEAPAAVFLASWCLELSLKAYLASKGQRKAELRSIQHNLAALWSKAASHGLGLPGTPPRWCTLLSTTHNSPYHQRYPTDAAAFIAPNLHVVEGELRALLALVEHSL